jgi:hypothetical protein
VGNVKADYLAKEGTKISQTSACKLIFHYSKLKMKKKSLQVDLSEYYVVKVSINPGTK